MDAKLSFRQMHCLNMVQFADTSEKIIQRASSIQNSITNKYRVIIEANCDGKYL